MRHKWSRTHSTRTSHSHRKFTYVHATKSTTCCPVPYTVVPCVGFCTALFREQTIKRSKRFMQHTRRLFTDPLLICGSQPSDRSVIETANACSGTNTRMSSVFRSRTVHVCCSPFSVTRGAPRGGGLRYTPNGSSPKIRESQIKILTNGDENIESEWRRM
jgi:hypothetical protein